MQDNYRKWILRLKNKKVFSLSECESFLSKINKDLEVDKETKAFLPLMKRKSNRLLLQIMIFMLKIIIKVILLQQILKELMGEQKIFIGMKLKIKK